MGTRYPWVPFAVSFSLAEAGNDLDEIKMELGKSGLARIKTETLIRGSTFYAIVSRVSCTVTPKPTVTL